MNKSALTQGSWQGKRDRCRCDFSTTIHPYLYRKIRVDKKQRHWRYLEDWTLIGELREVKPGEDMSL
ncbi:hypothetical protein C5167_002414 [Papaver somniferum]|uniref:Uncharacterized protein n=1 Tax=Papaver somniferum TaxID=3469 RepID=A0A4Y7L1G5_PAPSO|nr:hypothetical protein C5167_002414 [Papaver somniferum]